MITKSAKDYATNKDLALSFAILFLKKEKVRLSNDMALQGVGAGITDYRPWQVESIDKALRALEKEK